MSLISHGALAPVAAGRKMWLVVVTPGDGRFPTESSRLSPDISQLGSRRREEADVDHDTPGPPPHVGGYRLSWIQAGYEISGLAGAFATLCAAQASHKPAAERTAALRNWGDSLVRPACRFAGIPSLTGLASLG